MLFLDLKLAAVLDRINAVCSQDKTNIVTDHPAHSIKNYIQYYYLNFGIGY